jgi:hypothetical protein
MGLNISKLLQNKDAIFNMFIECDSLIIDTLGENQLNKLLEPYNINTKEWLKCKPGAGVYWRNTLTNMLLSCSL